MKKKIITASLLGILGMASMPTSATESIAFSLNVHPTCTGCHTSQNNAGRGNLMPAAKTAYNQDKRMLAGLKTFLAVSATPALTCLDTEVLKNNVCVAKPVVPTCLNTEILKNNVCVAKPVVPTCLNTEILKNNVCVAKPTTTSTTNTKPKLNPVAQQWDAQVGEVLTIPLSVDDAEQDDFTILASKLVGSTLSNVYQNDAGFPTIDFEWTPTLANVNKIQAIKFQAKETITTQKYASNKISVKVRVWIKDDRDNVSIAKLNVMKSKFSAGSLNLSGNVKFNKLLTAVERQAFINQALPLTVNDVNGSNLYADSLALDKKGNWTVSIPMDFAPCDITLEFAGQNASRKVIGCSQTVQTNSGNILVSNDDDDHDDDHDKNKKHDD